MKYVDAKVVFREVPDELTLAVSISNCPVKCPGCHSSYLAQDIGEVFDFSTVKRLVESNPGITCLAFMGGDAEPGNVAELSRETKKTYPSLKTCWYSGRGLDAAEPFAPAFDFIKVGPYIDEKGPLDVPTTNQRFYAVSVKDGRVILDNWTYKFQQKK